MDPLTISPSWPEHCAQLVPGLGFVNFTSDDNDASESDDVIRLLRTNLTRILELPYGPFASLMAFQSDLQAFIDSFLTHRKRLSPNRSLAILDVLVFSLFLKFVSYPLFGLKFSPASKTTSLAGLNVLIPSRLLGLIALYSDPTKPHEASPIEDLVSKWRSMDPHLERDIIKVLNTWPTLRNVMTEYNAAALRGLFHVFPKYKLHWFKALGGVRGNFKEGLAFLSKWYDASKSSESERGNILECAYQSLLSLDAENMEVFLDTTGDLSENESRLLADLLHGSDIRERLLKLGDHLKVDSTRVEYTILLMESFSSSEHIGDRNYDQHQMFMQIEKEEEIFNADVGEEETKGERSGLDTEVNQEEVKIELVHELAPHLGRYFIRKLLEAFNWNTERAIASVFDGSMPPQVAALDFSLEEGPTTSIGFLSSTAESVQLKKSSEAEHDVLEQGVDADLRARIKAFYDKYEDEYDDTLDGGGRIKVDIGAINLDEDDSSNELADDKDSVDEEEVAESLTTSKTTKIASKAPFVPRTVLEPARAASKPAKRDAQGRDKRKQQHDGTQEHKLKHDPRAMIPVVERHSVVDVNGERRNMKGELVEEDVLMRPNMNRSHGPPPQSSVHAVVETKPKLTPEQEADRIKRDRARKERQGNKQRERGADRKQSKAAF